VVTAGFLMWAAGAFAGQLVIGKGQVQPGQSVTVPVTYVAGKAGNTVAVAVATDIYFNTKVLSNPRCEAGSALSHAAAAKSVKCAEPKPGSLRLAVFGLNVAPMPEGEVALVTFDVAADARPARYRLRQKASAADAAGNDFRLGSHNGAVSVATP